MVPHLSNLTRLVLHELLVQALHETHNAHDLVWFNATRYDTTNVLEEVNQIITWLGREQDGGNTVTPVLCTTSGKILAKYDGNNVYLWCRQHKQWEERSLEEMYKKHQQQTQ